MRQSYYNPEYLVCKQIAAYLRLQYTNVLFHFDYAGNHLTKTQAGMMCAIQGKRGWPDLFIAESRQGYSGLFLEIKADNVRLLKRTGEPASDHLHEQFTTLKGLLERGYLTHFACGFDEAKKFIDEYLK